jgi:hypothetical protein
VTAEDEAERRCRSRRRVKGKGYVYDYTRTYLTKSNEYVCRRRRWMTRVLYERVVGDFFVFFFPLCCASDI